MRITIKNRNFIQYTFFFVAFVVFILAVMPAHKMPELNSWDKLNHFMAFFALAVLHLYGFMLRYVVVFVLLASYGVFIEIAQYFSINRSSEILDVIADMSGVVAAIILVYTFRILINKNIIKP